jgi:hypothetical protein
VELLSSAAEELGSGLAKDTFLRESVNEQERCPYPIVGCQRRPNDKCRGSNHHRSLSSQRRGETLVVLDGERPLLLLSP